MEWWYLLVYALALIGVAALVEEHVNHPDWLAEVPFLRWTANVAVGAVTGLVVVFGLYALALIWQAVVTFALALVVLWVLFLGLVRLLDVLGLKSVARDSGLDLCRPADSDVVPRRAHPLGSRATKSFGTILRPLQCLPPVDTFSPV